MRAGGARELSGAKNNSIVGILVNERQSEMIVLMQRVAKLKLVLRGDDYGDETSGPSVTDENFMGVFGLNGAVDPEAESEHFGNRNQHTMRIYSGGSYQTFQFQDGQPVDTSQETSYSDADSADSDDYNRRPEIESGLEEDQYPGE